MDRLVSIFIYFDAGSGIHTMQCGVVVVGVVKVVIKVVVVT